MNSDSPTKNVATEKKDGHEGGNMPVELSFEQELELMQTRQSEYLKAIEDPIIFKAFLAQEKRAIIGRNGVFLRNQTLSPEQKKLLIDILAERNILSLQAAYLADLSAKDPLDSAALSTRKAAKAGIEAEFAEKTAAILGDELAARYEDFTHSEKLWKEMDKFALNMDPTASLLSDEQKIKIINLLKQLEIKNITELGDSMNAVLSPDQMIAYQRYVEEERLLSKARETKKMFNEKIETLTQNFKKLKN
jgi:hypothetical protein